MFRVCGSEVNVFISVQYLAGHLQQLLVVGTAFFSPFKIAMLCSIAEYRGGSHGLATPVAFSLIHSLNTFRPQYASFEDINRRQRDCRKQLRNPRQSMQSAAALPEGLWATLGTSLKQLQVWLLRVEPITTFGIPRLVQAHDLVVLQGGAEGIGAILETAPPPYYLFYLLSAGLGFPCSEDAFVVWLGSKIAQGIYGSWQRVAYTLTIVYMGIVASDMITFGIGVLLKLGFLRRLKDTLMRSGKHILFTGMPLRCKTISSCNCQRYLTSPLCMQGLAELRQGAGNGEKVEQAHRCRMSSQPPCQASNNAPGARMGSVSESGALAGLIQRFSVGFRGPLCLVCGFAGVSAAEFLGGVALGALGTMPLQLGLGYLIRDSPNVYLTALALAAGPNLVGHVAGPVLTAAGLWWVGRKCGNDDHDKFRLEGAAAQ